MIILRWPLQSLRNTTYANLVHLTAGVAYLLRQKRATLSDRFSRCCLTMQEARRALSFKRDFLP